MGHACIGQSGSVELVAMKVDSYMVLEVMISIIHNNLDLTLAQLTKFTIELSTKLYKHTYITLRLSKYHSRSEHCRFWYERLASSSAFEQLPPIWRISLGQRVENGKNEQ